jgi:alkylation response protein AidB-like acyl-CoA dehydrogenase
VNFGWDAEQEAFRKELAGWLSNRSFPDLPEDLDTQVAVLRRWQADLAAAGFVGVHWPREYGGRGLGWLENYILQVELARARAPEILNRVGVNLVGPTLIQHGTDAQQSRWLPHILSAAEIWCQLFSEPDAGSDLAALTTRAERHGSVYVVTGQKVWSSYAQYARWGYLLARTKPDAPKHKGLSAFGLDMTAPGVSVRPLRQMTGEAEFNEVFLDKVEVPAANRIGADGDGWRIASTTLGHERGTSPRQLVVHMMLWEELLALAAAAESEGRLTRSQRQRLAQAYTDLRIFRLHNERTLSALATSGTPGPAASVVKLFWSEMSQRMHNLAVDLLGAAGVAGKRSASRTVRNFLYYRAATIFAGTSEIQRNVLGERVLGLPR